MSTNDLAGTYRATYKSYGDLWVGVVKDTTGTAIWTCPHAHRNRDRGRPEYGGSAIGCAKAELAHMGMGTDKRGFIEGRARWAGSKLEIVR